MTLLAYLDESRHIGPSLGCRDSRCKESLVFGVAGQVLLAEVVSGFETRFREELDGLRRPELTQALQVCDARVAATNPLGLNRMTAISLK